MTNKEYEILKLLEYGHYHKLTVPIWALRELHGAKTFQCFMRDGCLMYKPVNENDLQKLAEGTA